MKNMSFISSADNDDGSVTNVATTSSRVFFVINSSLFKIRKKVRKSWRPGRIGKGTYFTLTIMTSDKKNIINGLE